MRIVIARCSVQYTGRLDASLGEAIRMIMVKADGCVAIHADGGAYKPLNWMNAPNVLVEAEGRWEVRNPKGEVLAIELHEVFSDSQHHLGDDPGLTKDGVEAHLQALLAENIDTLGAGWTLVRREYATAIGPVDILARDPEGRAVAIEIKRRGEIDGVEQLTRYLDFLRADSSLGALRGMFVAQTVAPQARTLLQSRGMDWREVDYDELRGRKRDDLRLF